VKIGIVKYSKKLPHYRVKISTVKVNNIYLSEKKISLKILKLLNIRSLMLFFSPLSQGQLSNISWTNLFPKRT